MFEKGQHVKVKDNAIDIKVANTWYASSMKKYLGKEFIILDKVSYNSYVLRNCKAIYRLYRGIHPYHWRFHEQWLEPVKEVKIKVSDIKSIFTK